MKKFVIPISILLVLFCAILTLLMFSKNNAQAAADNCTPWTKQNNGCYWRTCVSDSTAQQYCQESCNGKVTKVRCD